MAAKPLNCLWRPRGRAARRVRVGVYLKTACFTHGQFYVAASRVGKAEQLKFAVDRDEDGSYRTRNVVWREGLTPSE